MLAGGLYFDPSLSHPISTAHDLFRDNFAQRLNLTFREVEIIRLIRGELSTEQIADRLHVALKTVKTHRKNIYFKLGISKVTDLIQFAVRNGL